MLSLLRSVSLRYWRRHVTRALLVLCGIALGVATWTATRTLDRTLDKAGRRAATPLAGAADLYVSNGDAGVLRELAEPLARIPGVRAVTPLVIRRVILPDLGRRAALLLGVDLRAQRPDDPAWDVQVTPRCPLSGVRDFILCRKPVLLGRELDRALPDEAGHLDVLIAGQVCRLWRAGALEAAGPACALAGNVLVMRCADAAALFGRPDRVSRLDVRLEPGADYDEVRRRVAQTLAGRATLWTAEEHDQRVADMLAGLKIGFSLCGAGALLVGVFLVYNVLAVSVAERRRCIGILRSLGATRGQIWRQFLAEALFLGLVGGVLGAPLGLGLAQMSLGPMQQALGDVFVPLPAQALEISAETLLVALAAGTAAALVAGLAPACTAAGEAPVEALRRAPRLSVAGCRWLSLGGSLALALLGVGWIALGRLFPAHVGTYGGMGLLGLAALVLVPQLAALGVWLLRPLAWLCLGVEGCLAASSLLRCPGRTGLVIAALAIGVALQVQTGGLIRSNEACVHTWVDRSIAGDLFVTSGGPLSASGRTIPVAEPLADRLRESCPEMRVVPMRFRYLDWQEAGRVQRVLLFALDARGYYEANKDRQQQLPALELYRRLCEPGTALVSENFAALHGVGAGCSITLPGAEGPVTLRVLGTVDDYSCNRGTVIVDRARYRRQFDADLIDVLDVYLPPGSDLEGVRRRLLQSPAAAGQDLCVLTREELRGHILGIVRRLYGIAHAQEVVLGVVAVLGVVTALLISVLQRQRELGLLRAAGATRGQLLRSVLAEAVLLGTVGTVLGLAGGWVFEWYTVRILLFEEAGFLCPVCFPWLAASVTAGLALAGAVLAGLGPAWHAARTDVIEALACE
jgi:putative ABC transport system permease protein